LILGYKIVRPEDEDAEAERALPQANYGSGNFITGSLRVKSFAILFGDNSNVITVTFPGVSETLVGRNTIDTLTNKTITDSTNTVTASSLFAGAGATTVGVRAATAPLANQALVATGASSATWQYAPAGSLFTAGGATQVSVIAAAAPSVGQVLTATSATTATWQTSANVPTYAAFGLFYGLTAGTGNGGPTDYAATVAVKTAAGTGRVPFPRNGPALGMVRNDANSVTLAAVGTYEITFNVHTTEPGQLQLELNGAYLPETSCVNMNPTAGGHPIGGTFYITTSTINSIVAVVNCAGNSTALTITPADGAETHANSQKLTIVRIL
jgi:hypothetical protein